MNESILWSKEQHAAAIVLDYFGEQGKGTYPGGDYETQLITLMCKADNANLLKLSHVYPEIGRAVSWIRSTPRGIEALKELVQQ